MICSLLRRRNIEYLQVFSIITKLFYGPVLISEPRYRVYLLNNITKSIKPFNFVALLTGIWCRLASDKYRTRFFSFFSSLFLVSADTYRRLVIVLFDNIVVLRCVNYLWFDMLYGFLNSLRCVFSTMLCNTPHRTVTWLR